MGLIFSEVIAILGGFILAFFATAVLGIALVAGVWITCFILSHVVVWGGFAIIDGDMDIFG